MLILSLNLKKYILKINLIINKSSCLLGKKLFHREREGERERENHIKLSTLMNIYNMYILPTQIHVYVTTWKKKKKNMGCKRDSMERPLVNIYKF